MILSRIPLKYLLHVNQKAKTFEAYKVFLHLRLLAVDYSRMRLTMMQNVGDHGVPTGTALPRKDGDGKTLFETPPSISSDLLLLPCTPYTKFIVMWLRLCIDLDCHNKWCKGTVDVMCNITCNGPLSKRLSLGTPSNTPSGVAACLNWHGTWKLQMAIADVGAAECSA